MIGRWALAVTTVLTAATLSMSPVRAQIVTGQVVDSTSGTPVGSGFVVLLDSGNREVARALSTRDGRFRLAAQAGGLFRLRSERIGYQAFTSAPFELSLGQTLERELRVLARAIVLAAVEVRAEDRCNTNPDEAEETGLVWQEIRKALAATAWDGTQELARYRRYGYRREWDASRGKVLSEDGTVAEGLAGQPFTSLPAAQLAREGFVVQRSDGIWYNLPDAAVLQEDDFLANHCFHVVRDSTLRPGQIGLAFEPVSRHGLPDVRGALWLDETTSELRVLDVSFTQLPDGVEDDRVGGTVEFLMLPSGAWIVHRWQVRTPALRALTAGNRVVVQGRNRRTAIVGFNDVGGDVLEITTRDGTTLYPPGVAHLTGTVYDSTRAGPLADALVSIEGTSLRGRSDESGVFHFTAPFAGEYSATLSHAWIDSVGLTSPRREIRLVPDETDTVTFIIPHASSISRSMCSYPAGSSELGTVVGLVRDGNSGQPAAGRDVKASWQVLAPDELGWVPRVIEHVVRTNESGSYVLCGVPVGHPLTVSSNGALSANILFPRQLGGFLLFARDRDPSEPYSRSVQTAHRTWKVDLLLTGSPPTRRPGEARRVLSGSVTDRSTLLPVEAVAISLNGSDSTVTRADGTFDIVDVEWLPETNYVATRRLGYVPWGVEIGLAEGFGPLELSIQLLPQAMSVDPVEVTADAVERVLTKVGFYARQRVNAGYFLEREQIERKLGSARYVTELLTGVPGIEVLDAEPGQIGSSVRFRGIMSIDRSCGPPRTLVDGVAVEFELLEMLVQPEDVFAIEAYRRPSEIPTEYRGANSACGMLLIWTMRGR
jgi:hypothetical protein